MASVYEIRNRINNKIYIGSSKNYKKRWYDHTRELNNKTHCNNLLQNAWNKYGGDNFIFTVLRDNISDEEKLIVEQQFLDLFEPYPELNRGYNICKETTSGGFIDKSILNKINDDRRKLKDIDVYDIKRLMAIGKTNNEIIHIMDLKYLNLADLGHIRNINSWMDIGKEFNEIILFNKKTNIRFNDRECLVIYNLREKGLSIKEIMEIFKTDCDRKTIENAINKIKLINSDLKCVCCGQSFLKNIKAHTQKYCKPCAKLIKNKKIPAIKNKIK